MKWMRSSLGARVLIVLLLFALGLGLWSLFRLRFETGDVYPPYSSYRTDPLGARILHDALEEMPEVQVERLLRRETFSVDNGGSLRFYLGLPLVPLLDETEEQIDRYARLGGRAVLAFGNDGGVARSFVETGDLRLERFGIVLKFTRLAEAESDSEAHAVPDAAVRGGAPMAWRSARGFDVEDEAWQVLYRCGARPVVVERRWGRGSIVFVADSFLFSNEAMARERATEFLAHVLGAAHTIEFDERHLGIVSQEGVMMLVLRYRLQGVLLAFALIIALFIWRNSCSFIPKYRAADASIVTTEVDFHQGFAQLLLRHVPRERIVDEAVREWIATFRGETRMQEKIERVEVEMRHSRAARKTDPVALYNRLNNMLNERK